MNPNLPADAPEREEKAVGELDRGQWVEVIDDEGESFGGARVLHVETYDHNMLGRRVKLLFGRVGYDPELLDFDAAMTLPLLTDAQADEELEGERREEIATRFDRLAELMRRLSTPLPETWRGITVDVDFGVDIGKLDVIAEALGLKVIVPSVGSMVSVMWDDNRDHSAGVAVHFHGYRPKGSPLAVPEPPPVDPLGMGYTRADDEPDDPTPVSPARAEPHAGSVLSGIAEDGHKLGAPGKPVDETGGYWDPSVTSVPVAKPLVSAETLAEVAAMEERDRLAGGQPWDVADHPDNSQPGGWHHGQIR